MRSSEWRHQISQSRDVFAWGHDINPYRLEAALQVVQGPILDVGCAQGAYVRAFRARGFMAFGMDLLPPTDLRLWNGGWYLMGAAEAIPFRTDAVDTVTCFEVLEHLIDPEQGLGELVRIARRHVVVSVPDARRPPEHQASGFTFHHWLDRTHVSAFTQDSLRHLFERAGLEIERLEGINQVVPEILVLAQYRLPEHIRNLILRLLLRLPWRKPRTMTLLAVGRKGRKK